MLSGGAGSVSLPCPLSACLRGTEACRACSCSLSVCDSCLYVFDSFIVIDIVIVVVLL